MQSEQRAGEHPLDNVVWSALTTAHADLSLGNGLARHYPRDIAPFSAIAEPSAEAYADLAGSLAPGDTVRLFRPAEEATPAGWETLGARPIFQMVCEAEPAARESADGIAILELSDADARDMLALVELTKPGPFAPRTGRLGRYVGLRDAHGTLLAMAGERFRLPGFTEISAICARPETRGRGHGRRLAAHLMARAIARGDTPFLHVYPDNPALPLYAGWGFRERRQLWVIQRKPVAD